MVLVIAFVDDIYRGMALFISVSNTILVTILVHLDKVINRY